MIESFACRKTERLWTERVAGRFPADLATRALAKLAQLNHAGVLADLTIPPSNRLEALKGDRRGQHSIRVNQQWRICFRWDNGVHDCELVDYH
jgi:proteic killer suppression protein